MRGAQRDTALNALLDECRLDASRFTLPRNRRDDDIAGLPPSALASAAMHAQPLLQCICLTHVDRLVAFRRDVRHRVDAG